jgi:hypothetical protein
VIEERGIVGRARSTRTNRDDLDKAVQGKNDVAVLFILGVAERLCNHKE